MCGHAQVIERWGTKQSNGKKKKQRELARVDKIGLNRMKISRKMKATQKKNI